MRPMTFTHLPDPELDAQFYDGVTAKRLVAWVIDVCIVFGLVLAAIMLTFGLIAFIFPLMVLALNIGYRAWAIHKWSATLGMRAVGIELRNAAGDKLDTAQAIGHTVIFVFAFATVIGALVNMVMMLVTDRGQGLSDMILGTTAINRPADAI